MTKKFYLQALTVFLEDNVPSDEYPYLVTVYTGGRLYSGTTAKVALQLYGEYCDSRVCLHK